MDIPKISVIMPVYNASEYLREAIDSILNQTFKDFEFIIVEDGSVDNSLEILKDYAKKDKRIKLFVHKKNLGLQKSLNDCLKHVRGEYIARMDADDISSSKRFEVQYNFLEKNRKFFLVGSSAIVIDGDGNRIGVLRKFSNSKLIARRLEESNPLIHPSIFFRNSGKIEYREKFKCSEDYDLYLRLLSNGRLFTNIEDYLIKYRVSKNSFVSTKPNQAFYFNKAKEFYFQRKSRGKDDYLSLKEPNGGKLSETDAKRNNLMARIVVGLQDNQGVRVRRDIKTYKRIFGSNKLMLYYYILSFFPYGFLFFIKNKIIRR